MHFFNENNANNSLVLVEILKSIHSFSLFAIVCENLNTKNTTILSNKMADPMYARRRNKKINPSIYYQKPGWLIMNEKLPFMSRNKDKTLNFQIICENWLLKSKLIINKFLKNHIHETIWSVS